MVTIALVLWVIASLVIALSLCKAAAKPLPRPPLPGTLSDLNPNLLQ